MHKMIKSMIIPKLHRLFLVFTAGDDLFYLNYSELKNTFAVSVHLVYVSNYNGKIFNINILYKWKSADVGVLQR